MRTRAAALLEQPGKWQIVDVELDEPAVLAAMYRAGRLKLDELITTTYRLDEVNQAYDDMHAGRNIRGVILHEN